MGRGSVGSIVRRLGFLYGLDINNGFLSIFVHIILFVTLYYYKFSVIFQPLDNLNFFSYIEIQKTFFKTMLGIEKNKFQSNFIKFIHSNL